MNNLLTEQAPVPATVWGEIEGAARTMLKTRLAGRKLVDFEGPLGWEASGVNTGRSEPLEGSEWEGVRAQRRRVQSLVELRAEFTVARSELEAAARGAKDADLGGVEDAAKRLATAEDRLVFLGSEEAGVRGLLAGSEHAPLEIGADATAYPRVVSEAVDALRRSGVSGPYALALGPECYTRLGQTSSGGYPVLEHVRRLLDGPVVWAPVLDGAAVVSLRGGDFELVVGRDVAVGYSSHDASEVRLYLEESVTFRLLGPEAAVPLKPVTRS